MSPGRPRRSPGWYQDPDDPTRVRHWNGRGWTGRRRARPTWHVLPNDLEPDPGWVSPGGISASALKELLGEGATTDPASPPVEDRNRVDRVEEGYGGDPLSGPLHAERPARDWGGRSDRSPAGARPRRGSGAAFGLESRWAPRPGAAAWGSAGGGGSVQYRAGASPAGGVAAPRWGRSRVPLIVVVGLTIFSVLALLVNLGTGARARFSAVAVDRTFVSQADTACVTAFGGRSGGGAPSVMTAGTAMTAGPRSRGSGSSAVVTGPKLPAAAKPAGPKSGTEAAGGQGAGSSTAPTAPSAAQLTALERLSSRLGAIAATPAARPQVQAWLGEWQRYVASERDLPKAEAAHDDTAVSQDQESARVAAASADHFAADNDLGACSIGAAGDGGFESVP